MQKIFVLEDVDMRQSGEGKSYGVTSALAKSTNYKQIHELFVPGRLSAKFATSKDKFLLLKGFSQKEDGLNGMSENWATSQQISSKISKNCLKDIRIQ